MKKIWLLFLVIALALFSTLPAHGAVISIDYYFTENNAGLVGGPWAKITLSQNDLYSKKVSFRVDPIDDAFSNRSNFGLQSFYFNESTGFGKQLSIVNTLPSTWTWAYKEEGKNAGGGYGKFDFIDSGTGSNRGNPLIFDVMSSAGPISISSFTTQLSTEGYLFAGHIAGFNNGTKLPTSAKFATPGAAVPVPEPGTMMLLGSGLIGLAGFGRKKLRKR